MLVALYPGILLSENVGTPSSLSLSLSLSLARSLARFAVVPSRVRMLSRSLALAVGRVLSPSYSGICTLTSGEETASTLLRAVTSSAEYAQGSSSRRISHGVRQMPACT